MTGCPIDEMGEICELAGDWIDTIVIKDVVSRCRSQTFAGIDGACSGSGEMAHSIIENRMYSFLNFSGGIC